MDYPEFKNKFAKPGIELLPHRPPFLFVDELVSADETGALGRYTYTLEKNDFFKGHFPGFPVVPGVVLIESMAQVAGAALVAIGTAKGGEDGSAPLFVLATVDGAKFRKPVTPGDTLVTVVQNLSVKTRVGKFALKGYVNDKLAVEATVTCMMGASSKNG